MHKQINKQKTRDLSYLKAKGSAFGHLHNMYRNVNFLIAKCTQCFFIPQPSVTVISSHALHTHTPTLRLNVKIWTFFIVRNLHEEKHLWYGLLISAE